MNGWDRNKFMDRNHTKKFDRSSTKYDISYKKALEKIIAGSTFAVSLRISFGFAVLYSTV